MLSSFIQESMPSGNDDTYDIGAPHKICFSGQDSQTLLQVVIFIQREKVPTKYPLSLQEYITRSRDILMTFRRGAAINSVQRGGMQQ